MSRPSKRIALVKVKDDEPYIPLGLLSIAASCQGIDDIEIDVLDLTFPSHQKKLWGGNYDIVGFTCMAMWEDDVVRIAREIKSICNPVVIVGGPHATTYPDILTTDVIDFIIMGEGERSFPMLVEILKRDEWSHELLDNIQNLGFKHDNKVFLNEIRYSDELSALPFPSYDLIDIGQYQALERDPKFLYYKKNVLQFDYDVEIPYEFSRGCGFNCIFCSTNLIHGSMYRNKPIGKIMNELDCIAHMFKDKKIYLRFVDNDFTRDEKTVHQICNHLKQLNEDGFVIGWYAMGRVSDIDEDLAKKMKQANMKKLLLGGECGYQEGLERVGKQTTILDIRNAVDICLKNDIYTVVTFVIGFPWEDIELCERTINLALELKEKGADTYVYPLIPFHGTPVHNQLSMEGRILKPKSSRDFDLKKPRLFYDHPILKEKDIQCLLNRFWGQAIVKTETGE